MSRVEKIRKILEKLAGNEPAEIELNFISDNHDLESVHEIFRRFNDPGNPGHRLTLIMLDLAAIESVLLSQLVEYIQRGMKPEGGMGIELHLDLPHDWQDIEGKLSLFRSIPKDVFTALIIEKLNSEYTQAEQDRIVEILSKFPSINELGLVNPALSKSKTLGSFLNRVSGFETIQYFKMRGCGLDTVAPDIFYKLFSLRQLKYIDLRGNNLHRLETEVLKHIATCIEENTHMTGVDLFEETDEGGKVWSEAQKIAFFEAQIQLMLAFRDKEEHYNNPLIRMPAQEIVLNILSQALEQNPSLINELRDYREKYPFLERLNLEALYIAYQLSETYKLYEEGDEPFVLTLDFSCLSAEYEGSAKIIQEALNKNSKFISGLQIEVDCSVRHLEVIKAVLKKLTSDVELQLSLICGTCAELDLNEVLRGFRESQKWASVSIEGFPMNLFPDSQWELFFTTLKGKWEDIKRLTLSNCHLDKVPETQLVNLVRTVTEMGVLVLELPGNHFYLKDSKFYDKFTLASENNPSLRVQFFSYKFDKDNKQAIEDKFVSLPNDEKQVFANKYYVSMAADLFSKASILDGLAVLPLSEKYRKTLFRSMFSAVSGDGKKTGHYFSDFVRCFNLSPEQMCTLLAEGNDIQYCLPVDLEEIGVGAKDRLQLFVQKISTFSNVHTYAMAVGNLFKLGEGFDELRMYTLWTTIGDYEEEEFSNEMMVELWNGIVELKDRNVLGMNLLFDLVTNEVDKSDDEARTFYLINWSVVVYTLVFSNTQVFRQRNEEGDLDCVLRSLVQKYIIEMARFADPMGRMLATIDFFNYVFSTSDLDLLVYLDEQPKRLLPALIPLANIFNQADTEFPLQDIKLVIDQGVLPKFKERSCRNLVTALVTVCQTDEIGETNKVKLIRALFYKCDQRRDAENLLQSMISVVDKYGADNRNLLNKIIKVAGAILLQHQEVVAALEELDELFEGQESVKDKSNAILKFHRRIDRHTKALILKHFSSSEVSKATAALSTLSALIGLKNIDAIKVISNVESLGSQIVKNVFELTSSELDHYESAFGGRRNESLLITYLQKILSCEDPSLQSTFLVLYKQFIRDVLSTDSKAFYDRRYQKPPGSHLALIFEGRLELEGKWRTRKAVPYERFMEENHIQHEEIHPDFRKWMNEKIFLHKHADSTHFGCLQAYINSRDPDLCESILEKARKRVQNLSQGDTPKRSHISHIIRGELYLVELLNERINFSDPFKLRYAKHLRLMAKALSALKNKGGYELFCSDLRVMMYALKFSPAKPKIIDRSQWKIVNTDHYWDLFMCGTDVPGSCQSILWQFEANKNLLAYMLDGKNRLLAIQDDFGKTVARAIFRMLVDTQTKAPVLFMEKVYPDSCPYIYSKALKLFAVQCAQDLNLPLLCQGEVSESHTYPGTVESLGSVAPSEYVDANYGDFRQGVFVINNSQVIYQPSERLSLTVLSEYSSPITEDDEHNVNPLIFSPEPSSNRGLDDRTNPEMSVIVNPNP